MPELDKIGVHEYNIQYWDPYDQVSRKATGYVPGATVLDCIKWLSDYYGEENLFAVEIGIGETGPLEMTSEDL